MFDYLCIAFIETDIVLAKVNIACNPKLNWRFMDTFASTPYMLVLSLSFASHWALLNFLWGLHFPNAVQSQLH